MFESLKSARAGFRASLLRGCFAMLPAIPMALVATSAMAQHVANPFVGATQYVNPDYSNEVKAAIALTPNQTLKARMKTISGYPTAVWLDSMAAITGGAANNGRLGLKQHIDLALSQQQGTKPVVITLVIYDLPQRDCAALASNGEISIAANPPSQPLSGIQTYEQNYITPINNILKSYATNPNVRFVLVIEPDSLPNLITNTGLSFTIPNCVAANGGQTGSASLSSVYAQGIQYALSTFHKNANVYQYMDIGHSAWLGWRTNMNPAVSFYAQLVGSLPSGYATVDGFISDTANYTPTKEPYLTASEQINGQQVESANFYQYNPDIDEASYDSDMYSAFVNAGFPSTIGFLIDTSRNGWGGPKRPTGPSTSTDLNTFVSQSKIDERNARGQWCNQSNAGMGAPPTVNPKGYFAQLQAFVWIKPPGESDGTYATSTAYKGGNADENCDPTHINALANNTLTGSLANPPSAGAFFPAEFTMLVQNALPKAPVGSGFTVSSAVADVTVARGAQATDTVFVIDVGGFTNTVNLAVSGLPAGVQGTFSAGPTPTSSKLTISAASTATPGTSTVTVTGVAGTQTATTAVLLTVK